MVAGGLAGQIHRRGSLRALVSFNLIRAILILFELSQPFGAPLEKDDRLGGSVGFSGRGRGYLSWEHSMNQLREVILRARWSFAIDLLHVGIS